MQVALKPPRNNFLTNSDLRQLILNQIEKELQRYRFTRTKDLINLQTKSQLTARLCPLLQNRNLVCCWTYAVEGFPDTELYLTNPKEFLNCMYP